MAWGNQVITSAWELWLQLRYHLPISDWLSPFYVRYLRPKVKAYWAPICSLLAIKTADGQGNAVPSRFCEKKLNPTRSKTSPLLWQSPAVTPLAKQSNASRRPKPRQFGHSVTRPEGRGNCNPPPRGRFRIGARLRGGPDLFVRIQATLRHK